MPTVPALLPEGSSPRMRGAPTDDVRVLGLLGIIPADAGSTDPQALSMI